MKKILIVLAIIILAFVGGSMLVSKLQESLPPQRITIEKFELPADETITISTSSVNLSGISLKSPQPVKHPPLDNVKIECSDQFCSSSLCKVDYHEFPEMKQLAQKTAQVCATTYPKIKEKLSGDTLKSGRIPIIFKKEMTAAGYAHGSVVYINSEVFSKNPDNLGVIPHEIAHVVQDYPANAQSWVQEGIADYITYWLGYEYPWDNPSCGPAFKHYSEGYDCAAALLIYTEKKYGKDIVTKLNKLLREGRYSDSSFKTYTGKTVEELWEECKKTECAYKEIPEGYDPQMILAINKDILDEEAIKTLEPSLNELLTALENSATSEEDKQLIEVIKAQILNETT